MSRQTPRQVTLTMTAVFASLGLATAASAASVTGPGSLYDNQVGGLSAGDYSADPGSISINDDPTLQTDSAYTNGVQIESTSGLADGDLVLTSPSSFTAGSVVAVQNVSTGFDNDMPMDVSVGGNAVMTLPGERTLNHRIGFQALDSPVTTNEARLSYDMSTFGGSSSTFGRSNELVVTNEPITPIDVAPANGVSFQGNNTFGNPEQLVDKTSDGFYEKKDGLLLDDSTVDTGNGVKDRHMTLDLGTAGTDDTFTLKGVMLMSRWDAHQEFDVLTSTDGTNFTDTGVHVSMTDVNGESEMAMLRFDSAITASHSRFLFDDDQPTDDNRGKNEAFLIKTVPFAVIPEPASVVLLGLGGLLMLPRRRRSA